MDLINNSLPNAVRVNGREFSIYTDFRTWMRFANSLKYIKQGHTVDVVYLFKNEHPDGIDFNEDIKEPGGILAFANPPHEVPRGESSGVITLDYEIDADLIYSAFLGQYGIDLIDIEELHWHKFLALLRGLNASTKLHEVIGYRCYKKETRKDYDPYAELKSIWEIIPHMSEAEQAELDEFNRMFGG